MQNEVNIGNNLENANNRKETFEEMKNELDMRDMKNKEVELIENQCQNKIDNE